MNARLLPLCKRDPMTGCCTFVAQPNSTAPRMWVDGKCLVLARAAWLLAGREIPEGGLAWRTCLNKRCVDLSHIRAGTRAEWGEWVKQNGHMSGTTARRVINRNAKREQAKLNEELAGWILESGQDGYVIAEILEVSKTAVSRVRTGRTWAPFERANYRMAA